jgi:diguanylate cyclase (GGDEF)-like protein
MIGAAMIDAPCAQPDTPAVHLATDERWWRKAVAEARDVVPLNFDGFPEDLASLARDEGFLSAWALPLTENRSGEVLGCLVVWVKIAVEFNIGIADGLRKAARLARLVIGEQRTHHALQREALTDPLTGVSNRSALRQRLDQAIEPVTLALIDLDDFKPVNDTYGHNVGDEVLRVVAERISAAVREDDLVVRLGGDEFAVVFADTPQVNELQARADRIAASLAQPIRTTEARLQVTASVGMATGCPTEVVPEADKDLYRAKRHKPSAATSPFRAS